MIDYSSPDFWPQLLDTLLKGTLETLWMTGVATLFTILIGLPLGIVLVGTEKGRFLATPFGSAAAGVAINRVLGFIVNLGRSVPFIVLMIALIPLTRLVLGSFIGTGPAILPLTIIAIPFFARVVEIAVKEVDSGLLEASDSLGATRWQLVRRVILPETGPAIVLGIATTITSIINFSAMVGVVGGGGLGNVALTYGFQRYSWVHIVAVVVVLFVIVLIVQGVCNLIARTLDHANRAAHAADVIGASA